MSGTTAFAVKKSLYNKFKTEFPGITVWYGFQVTQRIFPLIWLGEIEWESETPAMFGSFSREETYNMMLTVETAPPGATQEEANDAAEALFHQIEEKLRDPRYVGVPGLTSIGIVPRFLGEGIPSAQARSAVLVSQVRVSARK